MPEPLPEHLSDYLWAQAVANGDVDARQRFAQQYGEKILQAVYIWCKPFCSRNCELYRAGIRKLMRQFLRQECDQILASYTYLLDQLENVVLKRYAGQAALSSFLFSILHPEGAFFHSYRISFVQSEKGKIVPPVWANDLSAADRNVLKELMHGHGVDGLAARLGMPPEEAQAAVERIHDAAKRAGWNKYWRHFMKVHGHEIQMPAASGDEDDENAVQLDPPDPSEPPDVQVALKGDQARVVAAFEQLSPEERVLIRLRYVDEKSVAEVARALSKTPGEIRAIEKEAMKKLRNSFPESRSSAHPPPPPPPPKPRERGAGASGGAGQ